MSVIEILRKMEYLEDAYENLRCPVCDQWEGNGHSPNCPLPQAIAEAEKEAGELAIEVEANARLESLISWHKNRLAKVEDNKN
ncbi:hypothetical protein KAR91_50640 [Candidatus Pacearchaeota archaeon]|nr:hypothetical protein [Candidatus Pacearchaeota archaeon]